MPAFSAFTPKPQTPAPRVVTLPPSAFIDGWSGSEDDPWERPTDIVEVGLRPVSQDALARARSDAAKTAWRRHPEDDDGDCRVDAFNDALVVSALAYAVCQPSDVTRPLWTAQELAIEAALTPEAQRRLWQELELLHIGSSPVMPEATDEEIGTLARALLDGSFWQEMDLKKACRAKRLIAHLFEEAELSVE